MQTSEKRRIITYFFVAILTIITAKFIIDDGMLIITGAFRPFFLACIIIYLIDPFTKLINRKTKLGRVPSVILAYLIFILGIASIIVMIVPSIIDSVESLLYTATNYDEVQIIDFINKLPLVSEFVDTSNLSSLVNSIQNLIVEYSSNLITYSTSIITSIGSVINSIVIIVFGFIMSFYALIDSDRIFEDVSDIIYAFFPKKIADTIIRISALTDRSLKQYLIGKSYACIILGILITTSIIIVNAVTPITIPYALLIGVIVGLMNFIPYVGGLLGTIPSIIIVMLYGFWEAMFVFIIITIAQQVDNIVVGPKIIGDTVGLKPFWIITGITVGGSLFGIMGMILSVPIVSVILQLLDEKVKDSKDHVQSDEEVSKIE